MLRVCGAEKQRPALSAKSCWCGGLFCGRGGGRKSAHFRRVTRNDAVARSREEFSELLAQADLFDVDAVRRSWLELVPDRSSAGARRRG